MNKTAKFSCFICLVSCIVVMSLAQIKRLKQNPINNVTRCEHLHNPISWAQLDMIRTSASAQDVRALQVLPSSVQPVSWFNIL